MKKALKILVCVLLIAAMTVTLFACGNNEEPEPKPVDVKAVFDGALAQLAEMNWSADITASGKKGEEVFSNSAFTLKVVGDDLDFYGKSVTDTVYDGRDLFAARISEYYLRGDKFYLNSHGTDTRTDNKYLYEFEGFSEGGYSLYDFAGGNSWMFSEYLQYFMSMIGSSFVASEDAVQNEDGSFVFDVNVDLKGLVAAALDMDKTIAAWADGLFAALKLDLTVDGIFAAIGGIVNDGMTVGAATDKVNEFMRTINPDFSIGTIVDLFAMAAPDYDATTVYSALDKELKDVPAPRLGESMKAYILRVLETFKDKNLTETFFKPLGIESIDAWFRQKKTAMSAANMLDTFLAQIPEILEDTEGIPGIVVFVLSELQKLEKTEVLKLFQAVNTYLEALSLNVKLDVAADGKLAGVDIKFNADFDASDYFYAGDAVIFAEDEGYELPAGLMPESTLYDEDDPEFLQEVLVTLQRFFGGEKKNVDTDYETFYYEYSAGVTEFNISVKFYDYGATELKKGVKNFLTYAEGSLDSERLAGYLMETAFGTTYTDKEYASERWELKP